ARVVAALLGITFALSSIADSTALARPDTRERARDWCQSNASANSVIVRERYTLAIGRADVTDREFRFLSSRRARAFMAKEPFNFAITSSLAYERFYTRTSPYYDETVQQSYAAMANNLTRVAQFEGRNLPFANPTVTIYSNP
ncbi:MAG: hypothetical protein O3A51_00160, partial [Verrucomicrobia bacterium]|nr:hypothetical protein [Verrucomicrobiota bacterium]